MADTDSKTTWEGEILSVQPRIRLTRSFDQRRHSYLGYMLCIRGMLAGKLRDFVVALGKIAHEKHQFQAGDRVSGFGELVVDAPEEIADLHKVSKLKVLGRGCGAAADPPPFFGIAPALEVYRQRGYRRLAAATYSTKCSACMWGCEMAVEMIIDQWNPSTWRYRRETFCYGPKSCPSYKAGATRKVPGRKGMPWEEEDWIDDEATAHRGPDD
jgi:hypothetical protein